MLSIKCKIHESNPNSIEMNSGGMPLYVLKKKQCRSPGRKIWVLVFFAGSGK